MAEKLFDSSIIDDLLDVYEEIDPNGEFSERLETYREEKGEILRGLKEAGKITWQEIHLPQEMMEKLMDKYGLTSWFANSADENG